MKRYAQPTIYTIIALLYLCVGSIFKGNQNYTLPIHGLYLTLTFYYGFLCFIVCKLNGPMKALAVVFFMHMIYGIVYLIVGVGFTLINDVEPSYFLSKYFNSIASVFVYYYFSEKHLIDKKWFSYAVILFAIVVFFQHTFSQSKTAALLMRDVGDFTDNSGYFFLAVMPAVVFLKKKPILMFSMIVYLFIMMLICAKRGAIICGAFVTIYVVFYMLRTSKHKSWIFFLLVVFIFGICYYILNLLQDNLIFAQRFDDTMTGNDSNRSLLYSKIWDYFINHNSIFRFLIGNGPFAASRLIGGMAHNDWLEIALSMGILGVIIYVRYWYDQIRTYICVKKTGVDDTIVLAMASFMFINLMKTFFSMSLDDMMIYNTSVMGFCFSQCNEWNINKEIQQYEKA